MARKTAKTVAEVKKWIKSMPHHYGSALKADKSGDPHPGEAKYLLLGGGNRAEGYWELLIPQTILQKCFLKPCLDGTHMYAWDDDAEKAEVNKTFAGDIPGVLQLFECMPINEFYKIEQNWHHALEMKTAAEALPNLEFTFANGPAIFLRVEGLEEDIVYIEKFDNKPVASSVYRVAINVLNLRHYKTFVELGDAIDFLLSLAAYKDDLNLLARVRPTAADVAKAIKRDTK